MRPSSRFHAIDEDFRAPYARDRDRIIHAKSFRRLEYKTQVFLNQDGDFFRTRLTHTLEVSQIARALAKELGLEESLAEAIAYAHDLGHTPFGHAGGDALDELLKADGHAHGFEHNFQSFRTVTTLEKRYLAFDGLNLTYATLEGILKHSYPYEKTFLPSTLVELFALHKHPSLEAMVVDRADEIAYMSHDIEDGINAGLITFETLGENPIIQAVQARIAQEGVSYATHPSIYLYRFSSHLINHLVYSLIDHSRGAMTPSEAPACAMLDAQSALPIGFAPTMETHIKQLKKVLFQKLYRHPQIVRKMHAGKECIGGLYRAFTKDMHLLPLEHQVLLHLRAPHRVIADYIATLSDREALRLYQELYGFGL